MATTPRDTDTVLTALATTTRDINPTIDTQKGPFSTLYYAVANETSKTEAQASYLQYLYQLDDPTLIDDPDFYTLSRNFGVEPFNTRASTGTVWFFRNSRPESGQVYIIYIGTVVSTADNRYNYVTTSLAAMNGDTAEAYYNATTRRYEIPVAVEAVSDGIDYDLPPRTISNIVTSQESWDGCENKEYLKRGKDPIDKYQIRDILYNKMQGLDRTITGTIVNTVSDIDAYAYDDIALVPSSDLTTFKRFGQLSDKMGIDAYIITDVTATTVQSGVASGGETEILLNRTPLCIETYCLVDGYAVPFSNYFDTTEATQGSSRALDKIVLLAPLQPAQTYEISYSYYDLIYLANTTAGPATIERPFGTDVLYRRANPVQVLISGEITTFAYEDKSVVITAVYDFTARYLRNPTSTANTSKQQFYTDLNPYDYQQQVEQNVNGLSQFRLTNFVRTDQYASDIEFISFDGKTEYPILSPSSTIT